MDLGTIPKDAPQLTEEQQQNFEDIEKQWVVKAVQQSDTYWSLLEKVRGSKLRLTKIDDEIYTHFKLDFSDWDATAPITEEYENTVMKSKSGKEKWRNFINQYENKVDDYSFGTIIRRGWDMTYDTQEECLFGVRMHFYAIEIVRNKEGLNDWVYERSHPDEAKDDTPRPKGRGKVVT